MYVNIIKQYVLKEHYNPYLHTTVCIKLVQMTMCIRWDSYVQLSLRQPLATEKGLGLALIRNILFNISFTIRIFYLSVCVANT